MSIKQMSRVWEHANTDDPATLLVLLALADWANDEGMCWPAIDSIADKCRISDRTAQRIIKHMEECGVLQVTRKRGRKHTNTYRLTIPKSRELFTAKGDNVSPLPEGQKVTAEPEKVTKTPLKGDIAVSPEPPEPSNTEPSRTSRRNAPDSRYVPCVEILERYWKKFVTPSVMSFRDWFGALGGRNLKNFLRQREGITAQEFERWMANRARSPNVKHSQPVNQWICYLTDYAEGPKGLNGNGHQLTKAERRNADISETTRRVFDPAKHIPGYAAKSLPDKTS